MCLFCFITFRKIVKKCVGNLNTFFLKKVNLGCTLGVMSKKNQFSFCVNVEEDEMINLHIKPKFDEIDFLTVF